VIEPTNGRAQTANRVSRPAAEPAASAEPKKIATKSAANSAGKSAEQGRTAKAKKVRAEQIAAKRETTPAPAKPADAEALKSDEETPAAKMTPVVRPAWAMADTRDAGGLQREIANALARDPKLVSSTFQVSVDENSVTLEGHAAGVQEHLQAQRLAQSYAWNRKLVDHIDVSPRMSAQK